MAELISISGTLPEEGPSDEFWLFAARSALQFGKERATAQETALEAVRRRAQAMVNPAVLGASALVAGVAAMMERAQWMSPLLWAASAACVTLIVSAGYSLRALRPVEWSLACKPEEILNTPCETELDETWAQARQFSVIIEKNKETIRRLAEWQKRGITWMIGTPVAAMIAATLGAVISRVF